MIYPERRLCIYPVGKHEAEILLLGEPDKIGPMFARIRVAIESRPSFERVEVIVGHAGLRVGYRRGRAHLGSGRRGAARSLRCRARAALVAERCWRGWHVVMRLYVDSVGDLHHVPRVFFTTNPHRRFECNAFQNRWDEDHEETGNNWFHPNCEEIDGFGNATRCNVCQSYVHDEGVGDPRQPAS